MRSTRRREPLITLAAALSLVGSGCHTAILDMRAIEEPVMLNALPYPDSDFEVVEVDGYYGTVGDASGAAATGPSQTTSKTMLDNSAQANAFELIGGHDDRVISGVEISASGGGANILIAFLGTADVSATGTAVEIVTVETGEGAPAPARDGESKEVGP